MYHVLVILDPWTLMQITMPLILHPRSGAMLKDSLQLQAVLSPMDSFWGPFRVGICLDVSYSFEK